MKNLIKDYNKMMPSKTIPPSIMVLLKSEDSETIWIGLRMLIRLGWKAHDFLTVFPSRLYYERYYGIHRLESVGLEQVAATLNPSLSYRFILGTTVEIYLHNKVMFCRPYKYSSEDEVVLNRGADTFKISNEYEKKYVSSRYFNSSPGISGEIRQRWKTLFSSLCKGNDESQPK